MSFLRRQLCPTLPKNDDKFHTAAQNRPSRRLHSVWGTQGSQPSRYLRSSLPPCRCEHLHAPPWSGLSHEREFVCGSHVSIVTSVARDRATQGFVWDQPRGQNSGHLERARQLKAWCVAPFVLPLSILGRQLQFPLCLHLHGWCRVQVVGVPCKPRNTDMQISRSCTGLNHFP